MYIGNQDNMQVSRFLKTFSFLRTILFVGFSFLYVDPAPVRNHENESRKFHQENEEITNIR